MSESAGASNSKSTKPLTIERFKTFEVFKSEDKLHRISICNINDTLNVGLSKFWMSDKGEKWLPCKKGHFYMNAEQWRQFAKYVPAITQALGKVERESRDKVCSSSGTH
jgi:hypothetical protein